MAIFSRNLANFHSKLGNFLPKLGNFHLRFGYFHAKCDYFHSKFDYFHSKLGYLGLKFCSKTDKFGLEYDFTKEIRIKIRSSTTLRQINSTQEPWYWYCWLTSIQFSVTSVKDLGWTSCKPLFWLTIWLRYPPLCLKKTIKASKKNLTCYFVLPPRGRKLCRSREKAWEVEI